MSNQTPFSNVFRPHDGMHIQVRKDLAFYDPEFTKFFNSIPDTIYEVGTKECKYNPVSDSITIEGFERLPSFFFHNVKTSSDFQLGQLVELHESGQRLYVTDFDYDKNSVELSFISPSDGVMNLLSEDGDFKYKTPVGFYSVNLIKEVDGNYTANQL